MDHPVLTLSWSDFDEAVQALAWGLADAGVARIYGVPRGGLCLAVALSHRLRVPVIDHPAPGCLVVDDIYDTGQTMEGLTGYGRQGAVWISKAPPTWFSAARVVEGNPWVVFPWEDPAQAQHEMEVFHASRQ